MSLLGDQVPDIAQLASYLKSARSQTSAERWLRMTREQRAKFGKKRKAAAVAGNKRKAIRTHTTASVEKDLRGSKPQPIEEREDYLALSDCF
jgi:hypothetical protein